VRDSLADFILSFPKIQGKASGARVHDLRRDSRMQRRKFRRVDTQLRAKYHGPPGVVGMAYVTKLSRGGCTITNVKTTVPAYLRLSILLQDEVSVTAGAAVRWQEKTTLGIEFLILEESDEKMLKQFLRSSENQGPRR